jgi:hypothetical protein
MAEIAIEMPSSIRSANGRPRTVPTTRITASAPQATNPILRVRSSISCCSGERVRSTLPSISAIRPTWVRIPVSTTSIVADPRVTEVLANSRQDWSPSGTSSPGSAAGLLATGALSPVRAASCASSDADATMRPSAGTMSPASRATRSPGTSSSAGISVGEPPRITRACGTCIEARASTLARALSS